MRDLDGEDGDDDDGDDDEPHVRCLRAESASALRHANAAAGDAAQSGLESAWLLYLEEAKADTAAHTPPLQ